MYQAFAYLIVICDKDTNAVKEVTIWSSPEWEQSLCLKDPTFVAYRVCGKDYSEAKKYLLDTINQPMSRYNWLVKYINKRELA